ncbi:hypothetical protein [Sphingorhabdus sp.]|uniref:hypothetical protein n=1 Tax=Sphingorhabdus sp. TaxID=1902408 RepID=UPI00359423F0
MSRGKSLPKLLRELERLLPHGQWRLAQERPWFSLTFSGVQMSLAYTPDAPCKTEEVARILEDHAFSLHSQIVADIAVEAEVAGAGALVIAMLVLDV